MCDFAAGVVDRVIPNVPVRQWVLTVPHGLRVKLAFDPVLTSVVLRQFIGAVSAFTTTPSSWTAYADIRIGRPMLTSELC